MSQTPEVSPVKPVEMTAAVNPVERSHELVDVASIAIGHMDDDDFDMSWIDDPVDVDPAAALKADTAAQLFHMGVKIPEGEEVQGVTQMDIDDWYGALSPEARVYESEGRQENATKEARKSVVTERILATMPELLEGKLPPELEALVGPNYALGANQSAETPAEAQAMLEEFGGVDMFDFSALTKRFAMFDKNDPDYAKSVVSSGHYNNPNLGRYIIAVPLAEGAPVNLETLGLEGGPEDLRTERTDGHSSINAKYVVGYIDSEGGMHQNANFMRSNEPQLVATEQQTAGDWV